MQKENKRIVTRNYLSSLPEDIFLIVLWIPRHGSLDSMRWLHEKGCPWSRDTFRAVALQGDLEIMKWLYENGCPFGENTFEGAARHGDLNNLEWLYEKGCCWGYTTIEACRLGQHRLSGYLGRNIFL